MCSDGSALSGFCPDTCPGQLSRRVGLRLGWEEEAEDAYEVLETQGNWVGSECAWASMVPLMECFPGRPRKLDTTCVWSHPDLSLDIRKGWFPT